MEPNPPLGVLLHSIGGLAAASFYIPYKRIKGWAWENFWIVGGLFSWIIAPWCFALWLVPGTPSILLHSPPRAVFWTFLFGVIWGVGGLTFGLTMRYLGIALGYAIALGLCAACGTLIPPLFNPPQLHDLLHTIGGNVILLGVFTCLLGIAFSGWAGMHKEHELSQEEKQKTVKEFRFGLGLAIAILCGVTSAAMAFAIAAGKPISQLAVDRGAGTFQVLPCYIFIMFGGFVTNFIWCALLMRKNHTGGFLSRGAPRAANLFLCIVAGLTWYFQFFFYGMGTTRMGKWDFSSWTLHMASIIIFSTLWGIALHEWRGTSKATKTLIAVGLFLLVAAMWLVGYGTHLSKH